MSESDDKILAYAAADTKPLKPSVWTGAAAFAAAEFLVSSTSVFLTIYCFEWGNRRFNGSIEFASVLRCLAVASVWGLILFALTAAFNAVASVAEAAIAGACLGTGVCVLIAWDEVGLALAALAVGPLACDLLIAFVPSPFNEELSNDAE